MRLDLGAGKHPSPLEKKKKKKKKKKKNRAHLINEFPSKFHKSSFLPHQKILFLSKVMLVFLPAPIYYSAGKRDRGKNSSVPLARALQSPPCQGQGGAEGPDAGPFAEEGAEGPRRLGRTSAPLGKSFRRKLKTGQRYYTRLRKNRKSAI